MLISIVSDTHGALHPLLPALFREAKVERILHAGDVGNSGVLAELASIAPTLAVRGNIDKAGSVAALPEEALTEIEGVSIYMTHIGGKPVQYFASLPRPLPAVAICGHSHIPLLEQYEGVLFLNPGAAGTRPRFGRPLTAALLTVNRGHAEARIITL